MKQRVRGVLSAAVVAIVLSTGCGDPEGSVLVADAEFDPVAPSDVASGVSEAMPGVAQTFTVEADGKFEEFWLALTQGPSVDSGVVRVTVRPVVGGLPNASEGSSIITPIDVDTSTLPGLAVEEFTVFDVGSDPGREVVATEQYAIVVEFVSRTGSDTNVAIARVLGTDGTGGDPYAGGTAAEDAGGGYATNADGDDYLFRTFLLQ